MVTAGLPLVLAFSTLLLVGCAARQAGPEGGSQQETLVSGAVAKQARQCDPGNEHWRSPGPPMRGGTFVWAKQSVGAQHLDVSVPGGANSQDLPQVYGRLVRARACSYEDTVLEPDLAKSWQVSGDGLIWTLKLRDDVKWHNKPPVNGRPFTAADVVWTIDLQKKEGALRSVWEKVSHEAPDGSTLVLRLREPDADFLGGTLGDRVFFILPKEVKEQIGDFKGVAVGTGPYMLKEHKANLSTTFERNPNWGEMGADGKPLPYIDEIQLIVFGDYTAEVAAMRAGLLDLNRVQGFTKLDADALKQSSPKLIPYDDTAAAIWGLNLNLSRKPFDDVRVRKAIALGMDAQEIIDGGLRGGAIQSGFLPTTIVDYAWPLPKVREKFQPDQAKAKQLLAEAGYGPGQIQFAIKSSSGPTELPQAEITLKQLEAVGINARIEVEPTSNSTTLPKGEYDASWGALTPASYFPDRWMGSAIRTGGSRNYTFFGDPQVDALSLAQAREIDPTKRKQIIDRLQDRLYELMPYVPVANLVYYRFYSCRIKNMRSTDWQANLTGITHAWLDPSGC